MASTALEHEVVALLESYAYALRRGDKAAILDMFTDDAVVIGTGADEWYRGRAEIARGLDRDLAQSAELRLSYGTPEVGDGGSVIWAAVPATVTARLDAGAVTIEGRVTTVLVRSGDRWLIAQNHFSVPAADQVEGHSYPQP